MKMQTTKRKEGRQAALLGARGNGRERGEQQLAGGRWWARMTKMSRRKMSRRKMTRRPAGELTEGKTTTTDGAPGRAPGRASGAAPHWL